MQLYVFIERLSASPLITIRRRAALKDSSRNRRWIFNHRAASIKSHKISSDPLNCSSPSGHVLVASFSITPRPNETRCETAPVGFCRAIVKAEVIFYRRAG